MIEMVGAIYLHVEKHKIMAPFLLHNIPPTWKKKKNPLKEMTIHLDYHHFLRLNIFIFFTLIRQITKS